MTKTAYWDRRIGYYVNQESGESLDFTFNGIIQEWFSTLPVVIERFQPYEMITSPDVAVILEHCVNFKPAWEQTFRESRDPKLKQITTENLGKDHLLGNLWFTGTTPAVYMNAFAPRNIIELYDRNSMCIGRIVVKGMPE
jgi:hypothetical protein